MRGLPVRTQPVEETDRILLAAIGLHHDQIRSGGTEHRYSVQRWTSNFDLIHSWNLSQTVCDPTLTSRRVSNEHDSH